MAKVIIIVRDMPDGAVDVKLDYHPPIKAKAEPTNAQRLAWEAVEAMAESAAGTTKAVAHYRGKSVDFTDKMPKGGPK